MPPDDYQRARNRDVTKRYYAELYTYGRSEFAKIGDDLHECEPGTGANGRSSAHQCNGRRHNKKVRRQAAMPRLVDWLNRKRDSVVKRQPQLAAKLPRFNVIPASANKAAVLLIMTQVLPEIGRSEHRLMKELVERLGEPAMQQLRITQRGSDASAKRNAAAVLALIGSPTSGAVPVQESRKLWENRLTHWMNMLKSREERACLNAISRVVSFSCEAKVALPSLRALARESNPRIRAAARWAIRQIEQRPPRARRPR